MEKRLDAVAEVSRIGPFMVHQLGSMRKATKVATFVVAWGIAYENLALGRAITMEEYADYWNVSMATAYRDLALFKKVWPKDRSPHRVWKWCRRQVVSRERDQAASQFFTMRSFA